MARIKRGLGGGGCPTKGGDIGSYPFGDIGSGYPTNYEEITPICDAILIDLKMFTNLNQEGGWKNDYWGLGNSGVTYSGKEEVTFQAQANLYGRFSDPYNVEKGNSNPYELDFTVDNKIQDKLEKDSNIPVVNFTINFGKIGQLEEAILLPLDRTPRGCLASNANTHEEGNPEVNVEVTGNAAKGFWQDSSNRVILVCFGVQALLLLAVGAWLTFYMAKIKSKRAAPALAHPEQNVYFMPIEPVLLLQNVETPT